MNDVSMTLRDIDPALEEMDIDPAIEIRQDHLLPEALGNAYLGGRLVRENIGFLGLDTLSSVIKHQRGMELEEQIKMLTRGELPNAAARYFLEGGE